MYILPSLPTSVRARARAYVYVCVLLRVGWGEKRRAVAYSIIKKKQKQDEILNDSNKGETEQKTYLLPNSVRLNRIIKVKKLGQPIYKLFTFSCIIWFHGNKKVCMYVCVLNG